jgi:hypothetical protein
MRGIQARLVRPAWRWALMTCVAASAAVVSAATVEVFGGNAQALQLAVRSALPGDVVLVHPGEYRLTESLTLNRGITVRSANGYTQTVLDGGLQLRCARLAHPDAVLEGFTIRRGVADARGGGVEINTGTLRACYFTECYANTGDGGAVYAFAGTVEHCSFYRNWARHRGGAVYAAGGSVLRSLTLELNSTSGDGGGVHLSNSRLEGGYFKINSASLRGGAVYANGSALYNLVLFGNWGAEGGGGLFLSGGQAIHCTVAGNGSRKPGAGLWAENSARVHNSIFMYNWSNDTPQHNYRMDASCVVSHTCADPLLPGQGNLAVDPRFEDVREGDLRLRADSPGLDAASGFFATARDVRNAPRPMDGNGDGITAPDLGAYERRSPGDADGGGTWDEGYRSLAGGWRWLSWFGGYVSLGRGWYWSDRHGYFFVSENSRPDRIYLFTLDQGWLFTSGRLFPYLYRFSDRAWLWHRRDSRDPRWVVNLQTGAWERW